MISGSKSIKFNDTIILDSSKFNLTLIKELAYASYYHDKFKRAWSC